MANEFKHKDPGSALTQAEFIASDGTGHIFDSQAAGDVLYASSTTVLARLAKATDGNVLELASGLPAWTGTPTIGSTSWSNANHAHGATNSGGTLNTSALGAGTLAVDRGGTGATTLTDKAVLISQDTGTDTLGSVALTTSGQIIVGGSSGPAAATITAGSNITITNGDQTIEIAAAAGGIASVAADTTPQVGGSAGFDLQAQLLVGNGGTTGIAISANGEVTMAAQPCVSAYNSTKDDDVTGNATAATVDFDTEIFDQNADFASDTFTAPITGRYLVQAAARLITVTTNSTQVVITIASSNRNWSHNTNWASPPYTKCPLGISATIDMDAADTLTITATAVGEGGNTVDIDGGSTMWTWLSVKLAA
jgi:hypothetical protein